MTNLLEDVTSTIKKFLCKLHGTMNDHNYGPILHVLFEQNNASMVNDQEIVNLLWTMLEELQNILDYSNVFPKRMKMWMDETRPTTDKCIQTDTSIELNDHKFVQVTCDNNEINRRVNAFIKRKRIEADAFNRREFCKIHDDPNEITCARTDAVFVPRQTKKSLLKIKRVCNNVGEQDKTHIRLDDLKNWPPMHPSTVLPFHRIPSDLKERLGNLQLMLSKNEPLTEFSNVYEQVKLLESRVLYLESLSPEYFLSSKQKASSKYGAIDRSRMMEKTEKVSADSPNKDNFILLDKRINELQNKLKEKAVDLSQE